ncbi:MAG: alanine--tRNA ligase, partial [Candidatus Omnitrophota bacterium]|nr:alanine--tRNA ligase [Candidatus Omnitrophota bacterium]
SEIFYDYGVNPKCPNGDKCDPDCSCGRFSEVWNLVFTQFNRKDGGVLEPLPAKNIDTGMGLERLVAVVQDKKTNYETDLFEPVIQAIDTEISKNIELREKKIIADHIRAITFAITDGIIPSNKERGSVVKRLINDSANIALNSGAEEPRVYKLVPAVVDVMKAPYPELGDKAKDIMMHIKNGEEAFILVRKQRVPELKEQLSLEQTPEQRGELYFKYRDTFGLPVPVILDTAEAAGISTDQIQRDMVYFLANMEQQKEKSRAGSKMAGDVFADASLNLNVAKTQFLGYSDATAKGVVLKLFKDNQEAVKVSEGDHIKILLDRTPFYAEAGGQIGDTGVISSSGGTIRVTDTKKKSDIYIHSGTVEKGTIKSGDAVEAKIDAGRRLSIMRNHTATHLLQAALRKILGTHVQQQGSLVAEDRLRFDFTHPQAIVKNQISEIESIVNGWVRASDLVETTELPLEEAKKSGALAFFAEKYGQKVRVVSIGGYSKELCGGTHVKDTGQIERVKITGEGAVAQGIRRLEAKTAKDAEEFIRQQEEIAKSQKEALALKEAAVQAQKFQLADILDEVKQKVDKILDKNAPQIVTHFIKYDNVGVEALRNAADVVKQSIPSAAVVIGSGSGYVVATASEDLIKHNIKANDIIEQIKPMINGNGGGRPQMAQAGTKDPAKIEAAVQHARQWLEQKFANIKF